MRADALVADVAELFEPTIEANGQRLVIDASSGVDVLGEERLLRQALANLVENAVRHCPAGGIVNIGARAEPGLRVVISFPPGARHAPV